MGSPARFPHCPEADSTRKHWKGIYAPPQSRSDTTGPSYGRWRFTAARVVKWNCVFRVRNARGLPAGDYTYPMRVPVGTLGDVEKMLREWTANGPAR